VASQNRGVVPRLATLFVAALALAWIALYRGGFDAPLRVGDRGTVDFVQYWSAFNLLITKQNPYDGALMHAVQSTVGQSPTYTTLMWNPPWTPLLMAPITALPFGTAALAWLSVSIVCLGAIACLAPTALGYPRLPLVVSAGATVFFYPVTDALILGQLSLPLTLGFIGALLALRLERYRSAGAIAACLTVKPHLFFLFIPPTLMWLAHTTPEIRRRCLGGFTAALVGLILLTSAVSPPAIGWWFESFGTTPAGPGGIAVRDWQTATLATALRRLAAEITGAVPTWPMYGLPLVALLLVGCALSRSAEPISWPRLAPPLACLSLGLNPYGWLYDQSLLVICQIAIIGNAWQSASPRRRGVTALTLVLFNLTIAVIAAQPWSAQHHHFWIPWALLALWWTTSTTRPASPDVASS